jgi:undecaprenyl-diphosphatase
VESIWPLVGTQEDRTKHSGAIVIAGVSHLLKALLQLHYLPLHYPDLGIRLPLVADLAPIDDVSSFPSTHAALFFSLSVPLWMRSRWLGAAAVVWTLLVICLPLLYLGYHWASDVVAGAVFGVALMLLLRRLIGATGLPDRVVRAARHWPDLLCAGPDGVSSSPSSAGSVFRCSQCKSHTMVQGGPRWL